MARRLVKSTVVRDPKTMLAVSLPKGSEVPEGITLGDHLFEEAPDEEPEVEETSGNGDEPGYPDAEPSTEWKVEELRAYAQAFEIDLGGTGNSKEKMVERIQQAQTVDDEG